MTIESESRQLLLSLEDLSLSKVVYPHTAPRRWQREQLHVRVFSKSTKTSIATAPHWQRPV